MFRNGRLDCLVIIFGIFLWLSCFGECVKKQLDDKIFNKVPQHDIPNETPPSPVENFTESIFPVETIFTKKNPLDATIPDSVRLGFYVLMGCSLFAMFYFTFRSYRLRLSRAERRYGVQGDRTTQELTPLPVAMEEESDNEDHTLFDINKQIRVS